MFPLRREGMVTSNNGPAIGKTANFAAPRVDHRLNSKNHTGCQLSTSTGASVVKHLRLFMKLTADTMAAKLADNAVTVLFSKYLNAAANVAQISARFDPCYPVPHGLVGNLAEPLGLDRS